jgi:hypothetical protein
MTMLEERFRKAQTFPGTQKIHWVIPASRNQNFRQKCFWKQMFTTTHTFNW